jgi:ABC-type transport system involved in multi-copper enzyme maturation permease subunit
MMLAWKAWRETRARFLLSAAFLGWFCSVIVVIRPMNHYAAQRPFAQAIVDAIYAGSIRNIFLVFVLALGLGGLAEEAARGSAPFTLALPVSRTRLVAVRAAVGTSEVVLLALTPTFAVLALGPLVGEWFSALEALRYSIQWAATGSVLYAVALLLSVRLRGAYAALSAAMLTLTLYFFVVSLPAARLIQAANVFALMEATHPSNVRIAAAFAAAAVVVGVAAAATERQDF